MLQDSLLNLVLNARDACGAQGRITLIAQPVQDTWLEFLIRDTGPGFSDQALAHAFEPFYTSKGGEGSGLGLVMVYNMTKLAGGQVHLQNRETGAEISLRLPLRPTPAMARPGLVLLVEDSPDLRDTVRDMLRAQGHTVIEAASVDEALELLSQLPEISMVLSDITLEGDQTGLDLVPALEERGCPICLMTSLPTDDPLFRLAQSRAPLLRKPFSADQLATYLMGITP
jgi:CheY-like chemotaxis protein